MHGRPRQSLKEEAERQTPKEQEATKKKARGLKKLQDETLKLHQASQYVGSSLPFCAELLKANPDIPFAWNFRKKALIQTQEEKAKRTPTSAEGATGEDVAQDCAEATSEGASEKKGGGTAEDAEKLLLQTELGVVEDALQTNPKAYGAWHHRRWLLLRLLPAPQRAIPRSSAPGIGGCSGGHVSWPHLALSNSTVVKEVMAREYGLLKKLLAMDDRNFHGWDYRRFLADITSASAEKELKFTEDKINENFSNYSAWHYRSKLLWQPSLSPQLLSSDLDLVRQALFTEPEDQSGWMYFLWLLGRVVPRAPPALIATWPPPSSPSSASPRGPVSSASPSAMLSCKAPTDGDLLLFFSEPVGGVSAATVSVEGVHSKGTVVDAPLVWERVGGCQSCAYVWKGRSMAGWTEAPSGKVRITVGFSRGIVSALGDELKDKTELDVELPPAGTGTELSPPEVTSGQQEEDIPADSLVVRVDGECGLPALAAGDAERWRGETVDREIASCRELQELEPDCKWVLFTLARLLETKAELCHSASETDRGVEELREAEALFEQLMKVDPFRVEVYADRLAAHRQCKALLSATSDGPIVLSSLGLSTLVPSQKLLLCTHLNLSHNKFRSAEGFERLQGLQKLDLSHNLISSTNALRPLGLLPHLTELDVSHNLIGAAKYDTTRYLFPSSLSNTKPWVPCKVTQAQASRQQRVAEDFPAAWECLKHLQELFHLKAIKLHGNPVESFEGFQEVLDVLQLES